MYVFVTFPTATASMKAVYLVAKHTVLYCVCYILRLPQGSIQKNRPCWADLYVFDTHQPAPARSHSKVASTFILWCFRRVTEQQQKIRSWRCLPVFSLIFITVYGLAGGSAGVDQKRWVFPRRKAASVFHTFSVLLKKIILVA